ncbi:acetyl-CoA hydrolase/transferase family protein [Frankia sp. AgB32]|uniref:acetyl-CoA hydrolase/transferase family protein n=1 Tax=Frankia sp. AgB32 TaxID=631119 RepID=UPI00200C161B|nr:acetyl-CoA hydrolase/transferase C-terminal domain-containing protein [Frankia sp. AgB32]MCK9894152.1 4-hydroxybutyrate CoA-transferase [Frankia sp. AgB32]
MRIVSDSRLGQMVAAHLAGRAIDADGAWPVVVASGNFASPAVALRAVDEVVASYRLFVLNPQPGLPARPGVSHVTPFVGPGMRGLATLEYVPCRLSLVPLLFAGPYRPEVVVLHTSLPAGGRVSLGTEVNILPAAVEAARAGGGLVVAQLNPDMPYTFGDGELPVDLVDLAVEAEQPLPSPAARVVGEAARAIGERVAALVTDGATLQMGIGGVPDATLAALTGRRGLRVWTETFSDGVLDLDRAGAFDTGADLVTSFLFGSDELYRWVDRNPRVRLLRTETVNDPGRIARQPAMTSINTALQVDLHAQANASYVRGRIWSGFGGQSDFVAGALHAPGGHAIIALPSWHARTDTSTVVPALTEPTTSFQHSYIVSEHGTAALWGRSLRDQARAIVAHVADPRARDELTRHVEQATAAPAPGPRSVR